MVPVTQPVSLSKKLPCKGTLEDTFQLKAYLDTTDGGARYNSWEAAFNTHKKAKLWIPIAGATIIVTALVAGQLFSHFMLFVFISLGLYITYRILRGNVGKKEKEYVNGRWAYANVLAKNIMEVTGGYYYLFYDGQMFLYNDQLCISADAGNGNLIAYNKESIKKASVERVHLGSTTVSISNTVGGSVSRGRITGNGYGNNYRTGSVSIGTSRTKTNSTTKTHYEWSLDIFTSFIDKPHITLVFPDDEDGEETAKRACALLS